MKKKKKLKWDRIIIAVLLLVTIVIMLLTIITRRIEYKHLSSEFETYHIEGYESEGLLIKKSTIEEMQVILDDEYTNLVASNETLNNEANTLGLNSKEIVGSEENVYEQNILLEEAIKVEKERLEEIRSAQEAEAKRLAEIDEANKQANYDTCEPYYKDDILIVNKEFCLPETYHPEGLTDETQEAFDTMQSDAAEEGIYFTIISGYRSYYDQVSTYNGWVNTLGEEAANEVSATPGNSEHQTGMAIDVGVSGDSSCDVETCFGDTAEGIWLSENAHNYGFIIRYPSGSEHITGYSYEPWHLRYVGVDAATDIYNQGITLEEYVGLY